MKGNDGTGNTEERDTWQTPQLLFDKLNKQYNFEIDCCAVPDNTKCDIYSSKFESVFLYPADPRWFNKIAWMNPPFSKAELMFETFFRNIEKGVCIYRCDNIETGLWQNIILKHATWVFIPKGRISYEGKEGKGSRFPSALIGFNVEPPKGLDGYSLIVHNTNNKGDLDGR